MSQLSRKFVRLLRVKAVLIGIILAFGWTAPIFAATPVSGITVSPGQLNFVLNKGISQQSIPVTITNNYSGAVHLGAQFKGINENAGLLTPDGDPESNLRPSLFLSETDITIPAGQAYVVDVVVQNLAGLSPGGHYATLVLSQLDANQKQASFRASVSLSLFIIKSEGAHQDLRLTSLSSNGWLFGLPTTAKLTFDNRGNVYVVPRAAVAIINGKGTKGTLVSNGVGNTQSYPLLPGKQLTGDASLTRLTRIWLPHKLTLQVTYRADGATATSVVSRSFWYIPSTYPVVLLLLALLSWRYRKSLTWKSCKTFLSRIGRWRIWKRLQRLTKLIRFPKHSKTLPVNETTQPPKVFADITPQAPKKKRKTTKKIVISDNTDA